MQIKHRTLYTHNTQIHVTHKHTQHIYSVILPHMQNTWLLHRQIQHKTHTHKSSNIHHTENIYNTHKTHQHSMCMTHQWLCFPNISCSLNAFIKFALFAYHLNIHLPNIVYRLYFRIF